MVDKWKPSVYRDFDELMQEMNKIFPEGDIGQDTDGQIIVYTNLRESPDSLTGKLESINEIEQYTVSVSVEVEAGSEQQAACEGINLLEEYLAIVGVKYVVVKNKYDEETIRKVI